MVFYEVVLRVRLVWQTRNSTYRAMRENKRIVSHIVEVFRFILIEVMAINIIPENETKANEQATAKCIGKRCTLYRCTF